MSEPDGPLYPAWRYHATQPARMVESVEADKALGDGWYNNPMLDKAPGYKAKPEPAKVAPPEAKPHKKDVK